MEIFLDSNILYQDYFFEKRFNKELLNTAKAGTINLYISQMVYFELREQYIDELKIRVNNLKKFIKEAKRLHIKDIPQMSIEIERQVQHFEEFYSKHFSDGILNLVSISDDILPQVIDRFVRKKKPFAKGKDEFKDTVIWLGYAQKANAVKDDVCYLLTNNTTDFCARNGNNEIHEDLKGDCSKFVVFNSAHNFLTVKNKELELVSPTFESFIKKLNLTEESVLNTLEEKFGFEVYDFTVTSIGNKEISEIFFDEYWDTVNIEGVEIEGVHIMGCEQFDITIIRNEAIINGTLTVNVVVSGLQTDMLRNESFITAETNFDSSIDFSFIITEKNTPQLIELSNFRIE